MSGSNNSPSNCLEVLCNENISTPLPKSYSPQLCADDNQFAPTKESDHSFLGTKPGRGGGVLGDLVYEDLIARGRTLAVAKEWSAVVREFEQVCGYKESYTRADLTIYLAHLRKESPFRKRGLIQSTIDKNLKAIKLLSQIQGWGFPKLSLQRVSPDDIRRPTLTKDDIRSLIQVGKLLFNDVELCYLALSTIYGLRRVEMVRLKNSDFIPETVTIHTAKGGRKTTQLIPPEIAPYLKAFKPCRPETLTHMFHRLAVKIGLKATGGFGWHAIRRGLATELVLSEASALNVLRFMRWSDASIQRELGMLAIYAKKDQARIDQEIFKIHPFLPYWGSGEPRQIKQGDRDCAPSKTLCADYTR